jgi:23S rRNA G2069 N7-methylase RlmK/C1962 C5-methylase RlmI
MKDYLKKKKFDKAGLGAYIVTQTGVADTRERPYKIETVKYDTKTHTAEHFYVLRDEAGNEVGREKTKKAAEQAIREYITDFKENVNAFHEWAPKEKNALYFYFEQYHGIYKLSRIN